MTDSGYQEAMNQHEMAGPECPGIPKVNSDLTIIYNCP